MFILRLFLLNDRIEEIVVRFFSVYNSSPYELQYYYYETVDDRLDEGNFIRRSDVKAFEIVPLNSCR